MSIYGRRSRIKALKRCNQAIKALFLTIKRLDPGRKCISTEGIEVTTRWATIHESKVFILIQAHLNMEHYKQPDTFVGAEEEKAFQVRLQFSNEDLRKLFLNLSASSMRVVDITVVKENGQIEGQLLPQ